MHILSKYNLTSILNKCTFHKTGVDYLGFHIDNHSISLIQSNIVKINSFPFSELIQPLIDLTTPKATFQWTEKHQHLFMNVFFKCPIVRLAYWSKTFYVNTDASKIAVAGAL